MSAPKPSPATLREVIAWLQDQLPKYGGGSVYCRVDADFPFNLVGRYHEQATTIEAQLRDMFANGQRHIAVMLWFVPMSGPNPPPTHIREHVVDSLGGSLFAQHKTNIADFVSLLSQIGYEELHWRFAAQGSVAWPLYWTAWNQAQFEENRSFILDTIDFLEGLNSPLKIVYDLAVEHGNERFDTNEIHRQYCIELWRAYLAAHRPEDSCAFSIIHGAAGVRAMITRIQEANLPLPGCYCSDQYGREYQCLTGIYAALQDVSADEAKKPIYVQETFYNDPQVAIDVQRAVSDTGMNLAGLYQWPKLRNPDPNNPFPDIYPKAFDKYVGLL